MTKHERAKELIRNGLSFKQAARELGVSDGTIARWVDDAARKRWNARKLAKDKTAAGRARRRAYGETPNGRARIVLTNSRTRARKLGYEPCSISAEELVANMADRCRICGAEPLGQRLHLDHCHATGKFRGWLCRRCNLVIGQVGDNVELLRQMIEYLRSPC